MVVAMLAASGKEAINLGGEVPMDQIAQAVQQFDVDTVGITFSSAYQYKTIRSHLFELRALLPERVQIWTGGEGVRRLRNLPVGITKISSLEKLPAGQLPLEEVLVTDRFA
jgi:methylmalonyl-CoA mutase cobalamin-binding subunit